MKDYLPCDSSFAVYLGSAAFSSLARAVAKRGARLIITLLDGGANFTSFLQGLPRGPTFCMSLI